MAATDTLNRGRNVQATVEAPEVLERRKYIGMSVLRTEDPVFLTGRAKYTDDVRLPGMLHAAFLRSPHPHARIRSISKDAALQVPGIVAVLTEDDVNQVIGKLT